MEKAGPRPRFFWFSDRRSELADQGAGVVGTGANVFLYLCTKLPP